MITTMVAIIKKHKDILIVAIIAVLTFCLVTTIVYVATKDNSVEIVEDDSTDYHTLIYNDKTYSYNTSVISILLMGIDTETDSIGQADVLELIVMDRDTETITIVAIPRDSMTEIKYVTADGDERNWFESHLALAYYYGYQAGNNAETGCMYTMQAVSRMFNEIPINYYAAMNISQLKTVHEIVGNLAVEVPNDSLSEINSDWTTGATATITSDNVETFLRTRDTTVDFSNSDRMERQEAYIKAYVNEVTDLLNNNFNSMVNKIYNVISDMTTNISYSNLETFANMGLTYTFDGDNNYKVVEGENVKGVYYDEYSIDEDALNDLIITLFYEEG